MTLNFAEILAQNRSVLAGLGISALGLPLVFARRPRVLLERVLLFVVVALLLTRFVARAREGELPWDLRVFHEAGQLARAGVDPYSLPLQQNPPTSLQNPPTALPLYEILSIFPFPIAARIWQLLSLAGLFLLVPLAWQLLHTSSLDPPRGPFPNAMSACVAGSLAASWGLDAGQMAVWTTVWLYVALWMRQHAWLTGMALALASIKPATMLPVMILFVRRKDLHVWAALVLGVVALCVLGSNPAELPIRIVGNLRNIQIDRLPGAINDYSFSAPFHDDLISVDRFLYCLGLRNRSVISGLQGMILFALVAWLVWDLWTERLSPDSPHTLSLIFILACLFLYHRLYDAIVLAVPLTVAADQARRAYGWRRAGYALTVVGLLLVLNFPRGKGIRQLAAWSETAGLLGWSVQAIVLPYPIWILLFAYMFMRWTAPRLPRKAGN